VTIIRPRTRRSHAQFDQVIVVDEREQRHHGPVRAQDLRARDLLGLQGLRGPAPFQPS